MKPSKESLQKNVTNVTLWGERLKSGIQHFKRKKMPKCVSGHLESFKTHLFLGIKNGVPLFLVLFDCLWPKLDEFCRFSMYFAILGGRRKHELPEELQNGFFKNAF